MNFLFLHSNISLLLHSTGISKEYGLILVSRQKLFSNFIRTTPRSKVHKVGLEVQANFWNYESSRKLNFGIFDENGNEKKWLRNRSISQTGFDTIYLKRTLQNRRQHHVYRGSQIETDRPGDNIDPRTALTRQIQYHFFHSVKEIYLHFTRLL